MDLTPGSFTPENSGENRNIACPAVTGFPLEKVKSHSSIVSSPTPGHVPLIDFSGPSPSVLQAVVDTADADAEEESRRLAWALQQEDEETMIRLQLQNLREAAVAGVIDAEDLAVMEASLNEQLRHFAYVRSRIQSAQPGHHHNHDGDNENEDEDDDRMDDDEDEEGSERGTQVDDNDNEDEMDEDEEIDLDNGEWDYERLLELGNRLGDVKTERWRFRAQKVIADLPTVSYAEHMGGPVVVDLTSPVQSTTAAAHAAATTGSPSITTYAIKRTPTQTEERCSICMDPYINEDMLKVLPCRHFFHSHCATGWLNDHNSCPMCKRKVTISP